MTLTFRKGDLLDTEHYIRFLQEIEAGMTRKEWLYLDPPEVVRDMMEKGILELWIAMAGDRLAAAFTILHPGLSSENYGYDLGLSEAELMVVVHMDTAAVHPDFRGMGLQRQMVQTAEQALAGQGKRIALCTVHPDNHYSLNNMQSQGYEIQKRIGKYGSERFILRKNIF